MYGYITIIILRLSRTYCRVRVYWYYFYTVNLHTLVLYAHSVLILSTLLMFIMYVIGAILRGRILLGASVLLSGLQVVDVVLPESLCAVRIGLLAALVRTSRVAEAHLRGLVQLFRLHVQLLITRRSSFFTGWLIRVVATGSFRRLRALSFAFAHAPISSARAAHVGVPSGQSQVFATFLAKPYDWRGIFQ